MKRYISILFFIVLAAGCKNGGVDEGPKEWVMQVHNTTQFQVRLEFTAIDTATHPRTFIMAPDETLGLFTGKSYPDAPDEIIGNKFDTARVIFGGIDTLTFIRYETATHSILDYKYFYDSGKDGKIYLYRYTLTEDDRKRAQ